MLDQNINLESSSGTDALSGGNGAIRKCILSVSDHSVGLDQSVHVRGDSVGAAILIFVGKMAFRLLQNVSSRFGFKNSLLQPRCLQSIRTRKHITSRSWRSLTSYANGKPKICLWTTIQSCPTQILRRNLVVCSRRKGKKKSVKAVLKRFKITGSGKVKYWKSGRNRRQMRKNKRARRAIKRPAYCNKQQAKLIKKMLCL